MRAKFLIRKTRSDKFLFKLRAANGKVILTSQMYDAKSSATNVIGSLTANAPLDDRYERKASTKGEPFFNLKAANGLVIGHSEMYSSSSAMEGGIASVKKNAPVAAIGDQVS
jgi:uncharacterized protein YegP (UPF0339 family)